MKGPETFLEAVTYFTDIDRCIEYVAAARWPNGVTCPTCGREDVGYLKVQRRWQCKSVHSKRQFSVKTGTIFEDSAIGLDKWLPAAWSVLSAKNGISSYELARELGVTQKTSWYMAHRIRTAMGNDSVGLLGGDVPVEGDETYVGGRTQEKKGRFNNKMAVVGIVEKKKGEGRAKAFVTDSATSTEAIPFLKANVVPGSTVYTDESRIYSRVKRIFIHDSVNHSLLEYVRGGISTNTIEGIWNLFKRSYRGTHTHESPAHLNRYVQEQVYKYNSRSLKDGQRFNLWLGQCGCRLTYRQLLG